VHGAGVPPRAGWLGWRAAPTAAVQRPEVIGDPAVCCLYRLPGMAGYGGPRLAAAAMSGVGHRRPVCLESRSRR
jgi:hypothetical protein